MIRNTLNALNTPADRNQARITKAGKGFAKKLQFKDVKLPVKIRDTHNPEKKIHLH